MIQKSFAGVHHHAGLELKCDAASSERVDVSRNAERFLTLDEFSLERIA